MPLFFAKRKTMSKLFIDIMTAVRKYAEATGKEKALFPAIIKSAADGMSHSECKRFENEIFVINIDNARRTADHFFKIFYGATGGEEKENAVFDCYSREHNKIKYSDYLFAYKKRDFDEKDKERLKRANEKAFRAILNEYIIGFKPKTINKEKNLRFAITPQGEFIAVKKVEGETLVCDLSASEQIIFNFLCT